VVLKKDRLLSSFSGSKARIKLQDIGKRPLQSLVCLRWALVEIPDGQNPDFSRLTVWVPPESSASGKRWATKFSKLGHSWDVMIRVGSGSWRLYRPVCTDSEKGYICFYYLRKPV